VGFADNPPDFARLWPADLHLIGKEILRFHAVFWPAFLMAADVPLPKQMFAHGWWLFDQEKMSKSRGNVRRPQPIVAVLGIDALRYFLLREMVFGQDGNFSYDALITRYNADLANGLGNLVSRLLTMIANYCGGAIPGPRPQSELDPRTHSPDRDAILRETLRKVNAEYGQLRFSAALERIWEFVAEIDRFITITRPWDLAKDELRKPYLETVLYEWADALRMISVMAYPALPVSTEKIWKQFGLMGSPSEWKIEDLAWGQLKPGTRIGKIEPVFPRVEKTEAIERMEAMEQDPQKPAAAPAGGETTPITAPAAAGTPAVVGASSAAPGAAAAPAKIGIEDFAKVELRVGQIKSAERVPKADKLLMLMVDIGDEVRQIVAGIATAYEAEKLIGRKVIVVTNLAPRKLRGVESNGMIVAASAGPDGAPVLAGFLEDVPVGARLK
jgi:methionyl-tRNA synthetase